MASISFLTAFAYSRILEIINPSWLGTLTFIVFISLFATVTARFRVAGALTVVAIVW